MRFSRLRARLPALTERQTKLRAISTMFVWADKDPQRWRESSDPNAERLDLGLITLPNRTRVHYMLSLYRDGHLELFMKGSSSTRGPYAENTAAFQRWLDKVTNHKLDIACIAAQTRPWL